MMLVHIMRTVYFTWFVFKKIKIKFKIKIINLIKAFIETRKQHTVVTLNCTIPLALSFSDMVTVTTFPGILMLGSDPGTGIEPSTVTLVILIRNFSSASGSRSYNVKKKRI